MRAWLPILDTAPSPSVRSVGLVSKEKIHIDLGQRSGVRAFFSLQSTAVFYRDGPIEGEWKLCCSCVGSFYNPLLPTRRIGHQLWQSAWILRFLPPHTPKPGLPPLQRTTTVCPNSLLLAAPSCACRYPYHIDTAGGRYQLWNCSTYDYTTWTTLPSLLLFSSHKHPGSVFISYGAAGCLGNTWYFIGLSMSSTGRNDRAEASVLQATLDSKCLYYHSNICVSLEKQDCIPDMVSRESISTSNHFC